MPRRGSPLERFEQLEGRIAGLEEQLYSLFEEVLKLKNGLVRLTASVKREQKKASPKARR
mgnify:CR=1 FL=1